MTDRTLLFVSGKGGVGKSAVAAAIAMQEAASGKRVLAIGMIDSLGLAAHLGVTRLNYEPVRSRSGVYTFAVDRGQALDEYLRLRLRVPRPTPTRQLSRALQAIVDTVPGVREIVSMGKPMHELWNGDWDVVVVDSPPTGQLISYLRAPVTVAKLVPAGPIRRQASQMRSTLEADTTGLIMVATPEELPVVETREAVAAIEQEALVSVEAVIANRVVGRLGLVGADIAALSPGPTADTARHQLAVESSQAIWLESLDPAAELPQLFGVSTPEEVAARLSEELPS